MRARPLLTGSISIQKASLLAFGPNSTLILTSKNYWFLTDFTLSTLYTGNGFTQTTTLAGYSVNPTVVTLAPGETKKIQVTFNPAAGMGIGDNQGYLVMDGSNHDAHMAAWARVTPAMLQADVLIIDNDFSDELGQTDYRWYYTSALTELGYT